MKNVTSGILFLCAFSMSLISCEKEKNTLLRTTAPSTPTFSSDEALMTALKRVEAMGEEERRAYEAEQGYKSLLTKSYELYEQINPETLTDLEPLYQHVAKHPDWLEIVKDNQGELEYNPIYADNNYSMIAGVDRMIIVGEYALKVFDDGLISAPLEALEVLRSSEGQSVNDVAKNKDFMVTEFSSNTYAQKTNCGLDREDISTNGNNRTKLTLEAYLKAFNSAFPIPVGEAQATIIPQLRTLGIWFRARRTSNGRFQFNLAYDLIGINGNVTVIEEPFNNVIAPVLAYKRQGTYSFVIGLAPNNYRMSFIDSFGDTFSTPPAEIVCH